MKGIFAVKGCTEQITTRSAGPNHPMRKIDGTCPACCWRLNLWERVTGGAVEIDLRRAGSKAVEILSGPYRAIRGVNLKTYERTRKIEGTLGQQFAFRGEFLERTSGSPNGLIERAVGQVRGTGDGAQADACGGKRSGGIGGEIERRNEFATGIEYQEVRA